MDKEHAVPVVKVEREISRSANGEKVEVIGRLFDPEIRGKGSLRTFHIRKRNGEWYWKDPKRNGLMVIVNM